MMLVPRPGSAGGRADWRKRLVSLLALLAVAVAAVVFGVPENGSATTGDQYVLPPSQYNIPHAVMAQYYGNYDMTNPAKGSPIYDSQLFIGRNKWHSLYGGGVFYGYDPAGQRESYTEVLYNFHLVNAKGKPVAPDTCSLEQAAGKTMVVTLFGWGSPPLGEMRLRRKRNGDLVGKLEFFKGTGAPAGGRTYAVSYTKTGKRNPG
jgi:hypothetical protein